MSAPFCSMSGARTFIDSNLVYLNVFDAGNIASYLMGHQPEGVAPHLLPDVLHEAVHHWCFNTPVGLALAFSRAELMEVALLDSTGARIARMYIRQAIVTEILRPIIEGLACFAEFDAFPGDGNLRAVPLSWIAIIADPASAFQLDKARKRATDEQLIRETLTRVRSFESTARRKENLLAQPLNPRNRGGYLAGYMIVKGLQARTARESALAQDGELWLSFLRAYIFHDATLAANILQPVTPESPLAAATDLGDRFMTRLSFLEDAGYTASILESFNAAYSSDPPSGENAALGNEAKALERYARFQSAQLARLQEQTDEGAARSIRKLTLGLLRNRDWICVASAPGHLVSRNDGQVKFNDLTSDFPRFVRPPGPPPEPNSTESKLLRGEYDLPGALEFWVGPLGEGWAYVLASEKGIHAYVNVWTGDRRAVDDFLITARSNGSLIELSDYARRTIDDLIKKQPWWSGVEDFIILYLDPRLNEQANLAVNLYANLDVTQYGGVKPALDTLWDDGFYGVFGDLDMIRAVAIYGLAASLGPEGLNQLGGRDRLRWIMQEASLAGLLNGLQLTDEDERELRI